MGTKGKHWKWNDESRQNRALERKGTFWFTNGEKNIRLRLGDEIPEGFHRGLTKSKESLEKSKNALINYNKGMKGKHWSYKGYYRRWQK